MSLLSPGLAVAVVPKGHREWGHLVCMESYFSGELQSEPLWLGDRGSGFEESGQAPTSEAEGVMPGQWVGEARLVVMQVHGAYTWPVPTAGRPRGHNGVPQGAVCQPARMALVQATTPGCVQLTRGGQCGLVACTRVQRLLEGEQLRAGGEENFPWGYRGPV